MKKKIFLMFVLCLLLSAIFLVNNKAYARKFIEPTNYSVPCNIQFKDDDVGLQIKEEYIKFDIDLESDSYDTVKTKYILNNPTDEKINSKIYLPLLYCKDIDDESNEKYLNYIEKAKQIEIFNNNDLVEYKIRHYIEIGGIRNYQKVDIYDEYVKDDYFNQNLKITKYTYKISNLPINQDNTLSSRMDMSFPNNFEGIIFVEGGTIGCFFDNYNPHLNIYLDNFDEEHNSIISIYSIGQDVINIVNEVNLFNNDKKINGNIELVGTENIEFEDFIYTFYDEEKEVSKIDWHNAMIDLLDKNPYDYQPGPNFKINSIKYLDMYQWLTPCIEYNIEVDAHSKITTEMNMPVKCAKSTRYRADVYEYTYLLGDVSYFKNLEKIEIKIKINGYVHNVSRGDIKKNGDYYQITLDEITNDYLTFTTSTSKSLMPKIAKLLVGITIFVLGAIILIPIIITGIILLCSRKSNRKQLLIHFLQLIVYVCTLLACFVTFVLDNNTKLPLFVFILVSILIVIIEKFITKSKTFGRLSIMIIEIIFMLINTLLLDYSNFESGISTEGITTTYTILLIVVTIYMISKLKDKQKETKQLPLGYLKKSEYLEGILSLSLFIITIFILNSMLHVFNLAVIILIAFLVFVIYLFTYTITLQIIHQKPFRKFRKDLDIAKFEREMEKRLSNLNMNDEYRNYLMMIYINHIIIYNKEKASILRMFINEPKVKAYTPTFDCFPITVITKADEYKKRMQIFKDKYQKKKGYFKLINKFDEKYVAMTTGIAKTNIDELLNTNTKYEEDNAVNLFQKIFYYYHQGNFNKANELKEQFLAKYPQLKALKDILQDYNYFENNEY